MTKLPNLISPIYGYILTLSRKGKLYAERVQCDNIKFRRINTLSAIRILKAYCTWKQQMQTVTVTNQVLPQKLY